jgi:hypothetical protein
MSRQFLLIAQMLIATTPAKAVNGLVAPIEWFKKELGRYARGNAMRHLGHDMIFGTLAPDDRQMGG